MASATNTLDKIRIQKPIPIFSEVNIKFRMINSKLATKIINGALPFFIPFFFDWQVSCLIPNISLSKGSEQMQLPKLQKQKHQMPS